MPASVRIVVVPTTRLIGDRVVVLGGTLNLEHFGKTPSKVQRDQEHDAQIVFHAGFLEEARKVSEPEFGSFATLSGKLKLEGGNPKFLLAADAAIEPSGEEIERPRRLQLSYGSSFVTQGPVTETLSELKLPEVPENARFFELGLELKVDGANEAELLENDRLDVPLDSISFFEVEVLDEEGQPIKNQEFEVELPDGSIVRTNSDEAGVVLVDPVPGGACVLRSLKNPEPADPPAENV